MSTQITHEYKYKIFSEAQLKQFAIKLARFYGISTSDYHIFLHYRKDGYEASMQSTLDELDDNICKIGTPLESLGFHYKSDIITLTLKVKGFPNNYNIWYMLNGDIQYSKRLIFFVENSLQLARLEEEISQPTNVPSRNIQDNSYKKETKVIKDTNQLIDQTQMDSLKPTFPVDGNIKKVTDLPYDLDDENDNFGSWNYRVVKHAEQSKIVEVYYNKHGAISGWADVSDSCLIRENYESLKYTYDLIKHAFEKPILVVIEGDKLKEDI